MKQLPSERLKTVLKLAQLRERQAARQLADSARNTALNRQQEQQLQQYKLEYRQQFEALVNTQTNAANVENYQRFYTNLQGAGDAQQDRIALAVAQQERARLQWQQQYARQKNLEALIERKARVEQMDADNKVQRQQDDNYRQKQGAIEALPD